MLVFAFFAAVFSSVSWLIYAVMYISSQLNGEQLLTQDLSTMLMFLAVVFVPIMAFWMVFGYVNQFLINRDMNKKQGELLTQLQKNQDYTDLVVRVMLDAEHEIKDGFVLNKFDMFISDMNEALGEIIQRCNIASSAQLEQLWMRVRRGERWTLGKAILDASKNQSTFNAWVKEKVSRDKVFRGSLLEFCSRYQNLLQLLEKHDRDRVFVRMIESGVFGKVYSIIAPMSEGIGGYNAGMDTHSAEMAAAIQKTNEYTSALKLATMEEPKADESIINVDRSDAGGQEVFEEEFEEENEMPRESLLSRLNPFKRREEPSFETDEPDPFFQALHNSFNGGAEMEDESENEVSTMVKEPSFGSDLRVVEGSEPERTPSFGQLRDTLDTIRSNNGLSELTARRDDTPPQFSTTPLSSGSAAPDLTAEPRLEPSLSVVRTAAPVAQKAQEEDEEDLVYPFGGWTDENNYHG